VIEALKKLDVSVMTPLEAINSINDLQQLLDKGKGSDTQ
jgi:hypothetical protein